MQVICAVLLLSDSIAWGTRGKESVMGYYLVRISNFFVFFLSEGMLFLFNEYLLCYLFEDKKERKQLFRGKAVRGIAVIGGLLVIYSQFTHLYYYFDAQNVYHRNSAYFIAVLFPFIGTFLDLSLLIQYHKKLSSKSFLAMLLYMILPILSMVALLFYYGISLSNIAISISMILMFMTATVEQNEKLAQKEKEAADLKISLMLSQIAPHFIYNTLSTIQYLCEEDPKQARETVGNFAGYLRGNLDALDKEDTIPFTRELQHIRYYLAIEQKRFGKRVKVNYEIEEQDFKLPALSVEPLVENAVKHGICKKRGGGTVTITTLRKGQTVYIVVKDDGVGFDKEEIKTDGKKHIGLDNVENRLKSMCDGSLEVESKKGEGTVVCITLPQAYRGYKNRKGEK